MKSVNATRATKGLHRASAWTNAPNGTSLISPSANLDDTTPEAEELAGRHDVGRAAPGGIRPPPHLAAPRMFGHPFIECRLVGRGSGQQRHRLLERIDLVVRIVAERHTHRRTADYLDFTFGAFLDAWVGETFKDHVLETNLLEIVA